MERFYHGRDLSRKQLCFPHSLDAFRSASLPECGHVVRMFIRALLTLGFLSVWSACSSSDGIAARGVPSGTAGSTGTVAGSSGPSAGSGLGLSTPGGGLVNVV